MAEAKIVAIPDSLLSMWEEFEAKFCEAGGSVRDAFAPASRASTNPGLYFENRSIEHQSVATDLDETTKQIVDDAVSKARANPDG